jgi:hypothetical protein
MPVKSARRLAGLRRTILTAEHNTPYSCVPSVLACPPSPAANGTRLCCWEERNQKTGHSTTRHRQCICRYQRRDPCFSSGPDRRFGYARMGKARLPAFAWLSVGTPSRKASVVIIAQSSIAKHFGRRNSVQRHLSFSQVGRQIHDVGEEAPLHPRVSGRNPGPDSGGQPGPTQTRITLPGTSSCSFARLSTARIDSMNR